MAQQEKKERTIRSETTKVFLVIFVILLTVGTFTVVSSFRGANAFKDMRGTYLQQFKAAEIMKQRALDIIAIYYVLASDQDQNLLMEQLQRYDGLIGGFDEALGNLKTSIASKDATPLHQKMLANVAKTKEVFDGLNENCRRMTFALMEGKKADGAKYFALVNEDIKTFKAHIDDIESAVSSQLESESNRAQSLLSNTTWFGLFITIAAIFVTVGLIYYLMKFLSVSLLPISNLMHNMRQAVFSVDSSLTVTSPVSRYSKEVFSEEIVGKHLNDVAFRDLEKTSEAFANARTALTAVFGEDDVQWMLMEDCLPAQVKRDDKILKLTYTPLWNKQNLLQSIMVVAEDVTEIERLRAEALRKQGEIAIVQGLLDMDRDDIEPFLAETRQSLAGTKAMVAELERDRETRLLLFRVLHTIKGNARMYGLNAISEEIHIAESTVVDINSRLDANDPVPSEMNTKLFESLAKAEVVLGLHFKMASRLFGIQDQYAAENEGKLHRALSQLELASGVPGSMSDSVAAGAFAQAIEMAHSYDAADLAQSLTHLRERWSGDEVTRQSTLGSIARHYTTLSSRANLLKPCSLEPTRWLPVMQKLVNLSEKFDRFASGSADGSQWTSFKNEAQTLLELADSERLLFIRLHLSRIVLLLDQPNVAAHVPALRTSFNALWKYLACVCSIDTAFVLDQGQFESMRTMLSRLTEEDPKVPELMNSVATPRLLILSLLRALQRNSHTPEAFFSLASRFLMTDSPEKVASAFIAAPSARSDLAAAHRSLVAQGELSPSVTEIPTLSSLTQEHGHSCQLLLDLTQLLDAYVKAEDTDSVEGGQQMVTIPASSFNQIKSLVQAMQRADEPSLKESAISLRQTIAQALEFPVKSICRKMQPMVADLAKRLGKEVDFKVTGDDVALNRDTVYSLRDALVHMIRNSMDHGIEPAEERLANGKDEKSTIEVHLKKNANGTDVVLRDDGRGINSEKVVQKAIAKGIISATDAARMSEDEKLALIFVPNLSTKDEVTNISGRGVGMDAVKATIEKIGGRITVTSKVGHGTEICLSLPDGEMLESENENKVGNAA